MATIVGNIRGPQGPPGADAPAGLYLPLTGGNLTGPLLITGGGEADLTSTGHHLQLGASTGGNLAFDANEIQSRNNGAANVLNLNPHGGNVWVGSDGVAANLHLRGPFPTATPLDFWCGGQRIAAMFPYGSSFPVDLVLQNYVTYCDSIRIQSQNWVSIDGNGKRSAAFRDGIATIGDDVTASNNSASPLRLYGSATGDYIGFYHGSAPQTRSGYVGFSAATVMRLWMDLAGDMLFGVNGAEQARFSGGGWFLMGKTTNDQAAEGFQSVGTASGNGGWTNSVLNTPGLFINKVGTGVGSGSDFCHWRTNGTTIGSITRNAQQAAVLYNTTSDYRLKEDRGLITNARERITLLKPRRVVWKDDPTQAEVDGFFAHEVTEVVPDAVTGEKDAVATETSEDRGIVAGEIVAQQLDATRLIPLLVAAVQELSAKVDELESEIATLKGAA